MKGGMVRYKYLGLSGDRARFQKGSAGLGNKILNVLLRSKPIVTEEHERGCYARYLEAKASYEDGLGGASTASASSLDDLQIGLREIQRLKREQGTALEAPEV